MKNKTFGHLGRFLGCDSAMDLLPYFASGNSMGKGDKVAKEINESVGCFEAAQKAFGIERINEMGVVVVGDGAKPKTGSIFAYWSKPKHGVWSIDPLMREEWFYNTLRSKYGQTPKGLYVMKTCGGQEPIYTINEECLIVLPHSHCTIREAVKTVPNAKKINIISVPCCVQVDSRFIRDYNKYCDKFYFYVDEKMVGTPKNTVYIWENFRYSGK